MPKEDRELLILVGMPVLGKTYYCQNFLDDYARISQDEAPRLIEGILRKPHSSIFMQLLLRDSDLVWMRFKIVR